MIGAGIYSDDILVVDRSLEPKSGKIVIAAIDGFLTVKRLHKGDGKNGDGRTVLKAENPKYPDIELQDENEVIIWGVVTSVLHKV